MTAKDKEHEMRTERIPAAVGNTLVPDDQFDVVRQSLDQADDAPTLARAFAKPRRFKTD